MLYVGQKVVCVDAKPRIFPANNLTEGAIYTVRENIIDMGVAVIEASAHPESNGYFWPDRFRPVTEKQTDISIFKKMLTPSEIKKAKKEKELV